ncbi:MAG: PBECR4 domain-containing protein [Lachnospiraceae bacterium]
MQAPKVVDNWKSKKIQVRYCMPIGCTRLTTSSKVVDNWKSKKIQVRYCAPIGCTRLTTSRKLAEKQGILSPAFTFQQEDKMPRAENILTEGNKNRLRTSIIQGAINFEQYLNNKTFLILCDDNSQTQIRFFHEDYKHLTGIYSDLDNAEFYDKCRQGIISSGNIDTLQKYDWSTLKKKTGKIEHFHELLYSKADKSLLLNQLKTHTTVFPVAIRNDTENICVGFVGDINRARSLRNAKNSHDTVIEKQIIAVLGKKNGSEMFEEVVYMKEGYEINEHTFSNHVKYFT